MSVIHPPVREASDDDDDDDSSGFFLVLLRVQYRRPGRLGQACANFAFLSPEDLGYLVA
jgi:hypothetical protein